MIGDYIHIDRAAAFKSLMTVSTSNKQAMALPPSDLSASACHSRDQFEKYGWCQSPGWRPADTFLSDRWRNCVAFYRESARVERIAACLCDHRWQRRLCCRALYSSHRETSLKETPAPLRSH